MSEAQPVVFFSYTHALRHPVIIGHVAGWRLPWALSATQLGAVSATAVTMLATRSMWAHLGGVGNLVVLCLMVGAAGWAARSWRIEGRSPLRVAIALLAVAARPREGLRNGRPVRSWRAVRGRPAGVVVREWGEGHG